MTTTRSVNCSLRLIIIVDPTMRYHSVSLSDGNRMSSGSDSDEVSEEVSSRLKAAVDPQFNFVQKKTKVTSNGDTVGSTEATSKGITAAKSLRRKDEDDHQPTTDVRLNLTSSQQSYVGKMLADMLDREIEITTTNPVISLESSAACHEGVRLFRSSQQLVQTEEDQTAPPKKRKPKRDDKMMSSKRLKEAAVSSDWILKEAEKLNRPP